MLLDMVEESATLCIGSITDQNKPVFKYMADKLNTVPGGAEKHSTEWIKVIFKPNILKN